MSLSATIFGENSLIFKATNILGLGIPGLLHKKFGPQDPEAQVQRLGELSRQTAKEGDPRVIVWGRVRPIGGNIIHCQAPVKRWVVTSTSSGGKGGGKKKKQEQRTEHVYRTYAIGVCEGPITGFSRIWRNNKLVYDARGNAWGAANNPIFLRSFRLYLGGWGQMPDPTLQSIWGSGNVPAYRGTAYMVSIDEDLTDQGGMVPQWQFEVERAEGIYYTSRPYSAEHETEGEARQAVMVRGRSDPSLVDNSTAFSFQLTGGEFRTPVRNYTTDPDETIGQTFHVTGGQFRNPTIRYSPDIDETAAATFSIVNGVFKKILIPYSPDIDETAAGVFAMTGGEFVTQNPTVSAPYDIQGVFTDE